MSGVPIHFPEGWGLTLIQKPCRMCYCNTNAVGAASYYLINVTVIIKLEKISALLVLLLWS